MDFKEVYDISLLLGEESIDYPGDIPFSSEMTWSIEEGEPANLSRLFMSSHAGTHIDLPAHFISGAETVEHYPAREFIMPARVIDVEQEDLITSTSLENLHIIPGQAILFKTYNSKRNIYQKKSFSNDFVSLSPEAAELCVEKGIRLVGIDYITIEKPDRGKFPVHLKLLENNILILESINLKGVPPLDYTLFCFPLKIKGAEGAPVRAVLTR